MRSLIQGPETSVCLRRPAEMLPPLCFILSVHFSCVNELHLIVLMTPNICTDAGVCGTCLVIVSCVFATYFSNSSSQDLFRFREASPHHYQDEDLNLMWFDFLGQIFYILYFICTWTSMSIYITLIHSIENKWDKTKKRVKRNKCGCECKSVNKSC